MKNKSILIVDDDTGITETLEDILKTFNIHTLTANSGSQAIELFKEHNIDLILMDIKMPGMNGVEVLKQIKAIRPEIPVIMMTAYTMHDLVAESLREGAFLVLNKPFKIKYLLKIIEKASQKIVLK